MKIGYMRVSTDKQDTALQRTALLSAGCERLYEDCISGKTTSRPDLDKMLSELVDGDTLVVWKLDRLGRGAIHLLALIEELNGRGIAFESVTESFNTTTPMGRAILGVMAVIAQLERETIQERVRAGVAEYIRTNGRWGRKIDRERDRRCSEMSRAGMSYAGIAQAFDISKSTVCESIKRHAEVGV